jgi:N,N'-diacetyllegionaminate synthase
MFGKKDVKRDSNDLFFIAEAGTNFYEVADLKGIGIFDSAKLFIDTFSKIKMVDAIKFQIFNPELLASKKYAKSQYEYARRHSLLEYEDYVELKNYCDEKNVMFMATLFDLPSVEKYNDLLEVFKIASPDITFLPLIKELAKTNKPIILSTGGATFHEIEKVVSITGVENLALLHCNVNYNFRNIRQANLSVIRELHDYFPHSVIGYSDHYHGIDMVEYAYLCGANIIEKHIVLQDFQGFNMNDFSHSLTEFSIKPLERKIEYLSDLLGIENLREINERAQTKNFLKNARRGVYLTKDVKEEDLLSKEMLVMKRPQGDGIGANQVEAFNLDEHGDLFCDEQLTYGVNLFA